MRDVSRQMKTIPILRADGSLRSFEITSSLFTHQVFKILGSVEGVIDVKQNWFNDNRYSFKFHGEPFVVHEDYGDSDRYSVQPENPEASKLDLTPLHQAFQIYRWWLVGDLKTDSDGAAPTGPAFAVAVVACFAYMSALHNLPSAFLPNWASPVLELSLVILPVVCCGVFHYVVVRNSDLSKLRQWVQIAGAAIVAPLFGALLVLLVYV